MGEIGLPAYSPDPAPSDFHLFAGLKSALSGRQTGVGAVKNFLQSLGTDFLPGWFLEIDFT
ncbi:hypothetical protein AVEN_63584-1, partial [Araneus ventricosus]